MDDDVFCNSDQFSLPDLAMFYFRLQVNRSKSNFAITFKVWPVKYLNDINKLVSLFTAESVAISMMSSTWGVRSNP